MYFVKQLIYFHERNVHAGKKQLLHFTILPGNWPLWRSEILRNTLLQQCLQSCPLFQQALHFPGDIHTKCRQTKCHHFSLHNCVEHSQLQWCYHKSQVLHQLVYGIFPIYMPKFQRCIRLSFMLLTTCSYIYISEMLTFCWDMAVAHVLIRRTPLTHKHKWHGYCFCITGQNPGVWNIQFIALQ